ncbi:uncharacterized protein LOC135396137 [Ornithodoros turicata]|uniref:uncharacterized protein LOC135396137 n=1 Tax=Ornithodoros turicata TaxID=34597 RepID=UPI0031387966
MSMLVRKGTMLHRKGSRRASQPNLRRASIAVSSLPPSRRQSMAVLSVAGQGTSYLTPRRSLTPSPRNSLTPISPMGPPGSTDLRLGAIRTARASVSVPGSTRTSPKPSPRTSPRVSPRSSLSVQESEERRRSSCMISIDDRRRLYVKAEEENRYASYGSVSYQLREANEEATGFCDFMSRALTIVSSSVLFTAFLAIFSVVPLLMLIIGVQYLEECPKEPNIPLYLLIGGAFGLIKVGTLLYNQVRRRRYERLDEGLSEGDIDELWSSTSSKITEYALTLFLLVWFGMGNYWVLRIYKPRYEPLLREPNNWCDKTVYMFAIGHLLVCYAVIALCVVEVFCLAICVRICGLCCKK